MNEGTPVRGPLHRHAWVLDSLPVETRAVAGRGDPTLEVYLESCGLAADDIAAADALVVEVPAGTDAEQLSRELEAAEPLDVVAVAVGGGAPGPPRPLPRPVRALQLLAAPLGAARAAPAARRAARLLRERGLAVRWSAAGERSRKHGIGLRGWRPRRPPLGWIVTATRGGARPSIVDTALEHAAHQADRKLVRRRTMVLESGKILVEVQADDGERLVLRLAAGPTRQPLADSADCLSAIAAATDDRRVLARLALPRARGASGPAEFSLEPLLPGRPPRRVSEGFSAAALDFLVALREVSPPSDPSLSGPSVELQVERTLSVLEDPDEREAARRVGAAVEARTRALRGGIGHGDFWHENLLESGGGLAAVVDWEWCSRDAIPMLDLFDFLALSKGRVSQPTPGVRFTELLWPLAREGRAEALIDRYAQLAGLPTDAGTREALAAAYWLDRASRELLPAWGRRQRPDWVEANIRQPLATLIAAGW